LAGLPPLLTHVGEDEILRDNAVKLSMLAKEAGVDSSYKIYPKMWHVWQLFLKLPQAFQSLDEISYFLLSHLLPFIYRQAN
jgi:acetyl esterase/lipase